MKQPTERKVDVKWVTVWVCVGNVYGSLCHSVSRVDKSVDQDKKKKKKRCAASCNNSALQSFRFPPPSVLHALVEKFWLTVEQF